MLVELLSLDEPTKRYTNRPTTSNLLHLMLARMNGAKEGECKSYAHMIMQRHCIFKEPEEGNRIHRECFKKDKL